MAERDESGEIDMHYLFRKFKNFLKRIIKLIFIVISFFIRYWIITLILIIIGIGWGYFTEISTIKTFKSEGIVIPNYGSVDYLYSTIKEFNDRVRTRDTIYLQSILGENFRSVRGIKIEPIPDIYRTMTQSREQLDVFRILYQNQDLDAFIENLANSKYFKYHKIEFTVEGEDLSEVVIPQIFAYWNTNQHFLNYQTIFKENAVFQVREYNKMFNQIDTLLASISNGFSKNQNTGVVISDNNNLSNLFSFKQQMMTQLLDADVRLSDYTAPVKVVFMNYDIQERGYSRTLKYPIYLVGLFAFIFFLRFIFFRMKHIAES